MPASGRAPNRGVGVSTFRGVSLLISFAVGVLCAGIAWGYQRVRARRAQSYEAAHRDDLLSGLLVAAAFAGGVFLAYTLFDFGF
jgi:hypothetical protein